jgi:hypothetical protein
MQSFLSPTVSSPNGCQSEPYIAGANESAIVSNDLTVLGSSTTFLYLAPMIKVNGGPAQFAVTYYAVGSLASNLYHSLHNQAVVTLTPGASYQFVTGVRTAQSTSTNDLICRGLITIVRR